MANAVRGESAEDLAHLLADCGQPGWPGWQLLATLLIAGQLAFLLTHHDDMARRLRRMEVRWRVVETEVCRATKPLPVAA